MKRFIVVAFLAVAVASCDDNPKAKSKVPTAPERPTVAAPALASLPEMTRGSSVCMSYMRERSRLLLSLKTTPNDSLLNKRANALARIIVDACQ
jgi:hypothetical protein